MEDDGVDVGTTWNLTLTDPLLDETHCCQSPLTATKTNDLLLVLPQRLSVNVTIVKKPPPSCHQSVNRGNDQK